MQGRKPWNTGKQDPDSAPVITGKDRIMSDWKMRREKRAGAPSGSAAWPYIRDEMDEYKPTVNGRAVVVKNGKAVKPAMHYMGYGASKRAPAMAKEFEREFRKTQHRTRTYNAWKAGKK